MENLERRPSLVLLDAGGVLLLPSASVIVRALEAATGVEIDPGRVARAHYRGVAAIDASTAESAHGGVWDAFIPAFMGEILTVGPRRTTTGEVLRGLFAGPARHLWTQVVPGTTEGFRRLAATGVTLAVVSNSDGSVTELLDRTGVCQVGQGPGVAVRAIIDSSVAGVEKPDPAIFRLAMRAAGVEDGDAVLHVGDSVRADVAGARAAGIRPLHFDPYATCPMWEHRHVTSLTEVASLVASAPSPGD